VLHRSIRPAHPLRPLGTGQHTGTRPHQKATAVTYTARPGSIDDLHAILGLIDQASGWLRTRNTDQWATPWPNRSERDERVIRGLMDRRTWIIDDSDKVGRKGYLPAATISCRWDPNPKLWNELAASQPAVYVARLIVNRDYKGCGLGEEMLAWVGKWARKQYTAQWIRIDVWTTNTKLHTYYENIGFEQAGRCEEAGYPSAALFERSTKDLESVDTPRLTEEPQLITPFLPLDTKLASQSHSVHSHDRVQRHEGHASAQILTHSAPHCSVSRRERKPEDDLTQPCPSTARRSLFRRLRRCVGRRNPLIRRRRLLRLG
jgi:GNAT superfamily N-acetyltransferase